MTFAGVVIGCWLAIAAVAFLAISGLGRLVARGDVDAQFGIVGDAELRVLASEHPEERGTLELLRERFAVGAGTSTDLGSRAA